VEVSIEIPEDIATSLGSDLEKSLLEGLAMEGVRSGRLSRGQARRLLGLQTRYEVDGFLKIHGVAVEEDLSSVQRDSEAILALGRQ
jgi:hypothetical protein